MRQNVGLDAQGCYRLVLSIVPVLTILFGIGIAVAGFVQAPRDDRAAAAFRSDPGCRVDLATGGVGGGACRAVDVRILDASLRSGGGSRSTSTTPYAVIVLPDESRHTIPLVDADGRRFVREVYPNTAGRALLFGGEVVRVAANGLAADASTAPTSMAASDAQLPWVGGGLVVVGLLVFAAGRRTTARLRR